MSFFHIFLHAKKDMAHGVRWTSRAVRKHVLHKNQAKRAATSLAARLSSYFTFRTTPKNSGEPSDAVMRYKNGRLRFICYHRRLIGIRRAGFHSRNGIGRCLDAILIHGNMGALNHRGQIKGRIGNGAEVGGIAMKGIRDPGGGERSLRSRSVSVVNLGMLHSTWAF